MGMATLLLRFGAAMLSPDSRRLFCPAVALLHPKTAPMSASNQQYRHERRSLMNIVPDLANVSQTWTMRHAQSAPGAALLGRGHPWAELRGCGLPSSAARWPTATGARGALLLRRLQLALQLPVRFCCLKASQSMHVRYRRVLQAHHAQNSPVSRLSRSTCVNGMQPHPGGLPAGSLSSCLRLLEAARLLLRPPLELSHLRGSRFNSARRLLWKNCNIRCRKVCPHT
jgi:hypothetical protein